MRFPGYRARLTESHLRRMRIPRRFWEVTREGLSPDIRPKMERFVKSLDEHLDNGEGLLLFGNNGVGKTSAAVWVAKETRRRGASVLFTTAESLRQSVLDRTMFDDDTSLMDRAKMVEVLILDDLGKEHPGETGFSERLFENLIRERCANCLMTLITTNLAMKGKKGLEAVYIASMLEVIKEAVHPVKFQGENLRDPAKQELAERMTVG